MFVDLFSCPCRFWRCFSLKWSGVVLSNYCYYWLLIKGTPFCYFSILLLLLGFKSVKLLCSINKTDLRDLFIFSLVAMQCLVSVCCSFVVVPFTTFWSLFSYGFVTVTSLGQSLVVVPCLQIWYCWPTFDFCISVLLLLLVKMFILQSVYFQYLD